MQQFNPYHFYTLGSTLHPLAELTGPKKVNDVFFIMYEAKRWLVSVYLGHLLPLHISKSAADSLYRALANVIPDDIGSLEFDAEVNQVHIFQVAEAAKSFEIVFAAELQSANTYLVQQKGIYNTSDLVERAETALDSSLTVISEDARKDFGQAGRCLAFDLPTAAAFHLTRSIESVLRKYHALGCPDSPNAGKRPEMATCINELRKRNESGKLLDILDHFRDLHRNTTMHPEAFLESSEALRLFDIAKSALNAMADRIKQLPGIEEGPKAIEPFRPESSFGTTAGL